MATSLEKMRLATKCKRRFELYSGVSWIVEVEVAALFRWLQL